MINDMVKIPTLFEAYSAREEKEEVLEEKPNDSNPLPLYYLFTNLNLLLMLTLLLYFHHHRVEEPSSIL